MYGTAYTSLYLYIMYTRGYLFFTDVSSTGELLNTTVSGGLLGRENSNIITYRRQEVCTCNGASDLWTFSVNCFELVSSQKLRARIHDILLSRRVTYKLSYRGSSAGRTDTKQSMQYTPKYIYICVLYVYMCIHASVVEVTLLIPRLRIGAGT